MKHLRYCLIFTILLWFMGFWYMFKSNLSQSEQGKNVDYDTKRNLDRNDNHMSSSSNLIKQIKRLEKNLLELEEKYQENELVIQNLKEQAASNKKQYDKLKPSEQRLVEHLADNTNDVFPSFYFEETRRKIFDDVKEVSFFINSQLTLFSKQDATSETKMDFIKNDFQNRINLILAKLYNLSISDSFGSWRKAESIKLAKLVQDKFNEIQNPTDCAQSRKIICDLNKACGFGCQMHHAMYCFITSFFTKRVMILESNNWRYNPAGYTAYFEPLSKTCKKHAGPQVGMNEPGSENELAIRMPIIDVLTNRPKYLPLSVPKEYLDVLNKIHGDPFTWWAGQILGYLMRFNADFDVVVKDARKKLNFETPCVGVHVRRTDKIGSEASLHYLSEYMKHVDQFFNLYELTHAKLSKRNVFLATDDVGVILEAKSKYPTYNFIYDESNAKSASVNKRYSPESAQGVILDIYYLSECDYLVCTFSSQVCRLAYELMQTRYPDASWRFKSLDDVYYYGGQNGHYVQAIMEHKASQTGEIDLKVGDLVGLAGNHWDGYSKGRNMRTNQDGLFPSYKVKNVVEAA